MCENRLFFETDITYGHSVHNMDSNSTDLHNIMDSIVNDYKVKKVRESILLLKRKMCKTHDLIKQYSENMKEIEYLKLNLESAKKEAKHTISNYKSAMDKIRELELKIVEDKQRNEKLINKIDNYEINVAADKQIIQQLTCKIKNLEEERSAKIMEYNLQKSSFEVKIKDLEHELKKSKGISMHKKKEKKIISPDLDTAKPNIGTKSSSDMGINVSLCDDELSAKCEVQDKSVMTDEFYNIKDDPHPLFCAKCEFHLPPDLTPEKICRTMSAYPKLIERDLSPPKKIYSPPCSLPSTYSESVNRNEDALSRISMPHLRPYSPCSDSVVSNLKSQSGRSSVMAQNSENIELRNMDISRVPVVANLPNNLGTIPAVFTLSQNKNCAREDSCSDDLLAKHSSSIKKMKRKIRSLKDKMKKFRKLKKKINNNSCCRSINCKDDILSNSSLISIICKSVAEYYDEKKETCFKNKQDVDSEKCTCSAKEAKLNKRQLNKCNTFSCKNENHDEKYHVCDTFCNKIENAAKEIDILQCEHMLSVDKNNLFLDINTSSKSLNNTDESDQREAVLNEKSALRSAEVVTVEDDLATSHLSVDKIYTSDNLLDNVEAIDMDNKSETEVILSSDENSTDYVDGKITDINAEKNEIKIKSQNIHQDKIGETCARDNFLSENNVKAIDMDNETETGVIFLSNEEHSTDHTDGKIDNINAKENIIISKGQNIHEDEVEEICANNNLLHNGNIEAVDMDNETETERTFLSTNENSTDHVDNKIDINAKKNEIKHKDQNIHEDEIAEVCTNVNLSSKNNIEAIDMDNKTETGTIFLSNDEHSTDVDVKIIDINAKKNIITSKGQNIHEDEVDEICASDNFLNKDNIEAVDNETGIETTFLSEDENSKIPDRADGKIVDIDVETNEIKNKGQNILEDEIDEVCTRDHLLSKNNIEVIDMDNQTKTGRISLVKNKNSIDQVDGKIISINVKESKMKRKVENMRKGKVGDRLLKKLRCLKRKTQAKPRLNKQENIESYPDDSFEYELPKKSRIGNEEKSGDRSLKSNTNLKRNLDALVESINKQEDNKLCSDDYEPITKKLRIAHTPKMLVPQLSSNKNGFTHGTIRNIASLMIRSNVNQQLGTRKDNLLTENKKSHTINEKCDEKNVKSIETNNSINRRPVNEKDLDLTSAEDSLQNNGIALSVTNIVRVSEKCDDVFDDEDTINRRISMDRVTGRTLSNSDEPDALRNNIASVTANDLKLKECLVPLRTCIITKSKSNTLCKSSRPDSLTEALETIEARKDTTPTVELECEALGNKNQKKLKDAISNGERSNVLKETRNFNHNNSDVFKGITEVLCSPSPTDSDIVEDYTNDNMKESLNKMKNANKLKKTHVNNETIRIQAVQTRRKNVCMKQQEGTKCNDVSHEVEDEFQAPMARLNKYINQKHTIKKYKLPRKQISYVSKIADKFVKKQLQRLINSAWEETVHNDIIEKLRNTCGPRIIAKCIVEFLMEEVDHSEALDKSFTPPAPLMTTFEQKIIALLFDLEVLKPTVIYFVQATIEYNLFRLNANVKYQVQSLTRIYVVLSRIQKDREKIRMMCCDALYCMGLKSIDVLHTVLTCWSEVLPYAEANKEILPKCIAFLIASHQIENGSTDVLRSIQKLNILKSLVARFYKYNYSQETLQDAVTELMTALKAEQIDGLNTAIILLAKREGTSWTYKNIIQSTLLPMIKNERPCGYNIFSLLGRLLRAFPIQDQDNIVKNISEHLCDLIKSGQGSHDQQEGIISALLSLSRRKFKIVAPFVIKWVPSKSLRPVINTQLEAFINSRNSKFWKNYLESLKTNYNDNSG